MSSARAVKIMATSSGTVHVRAASAHMFVTAILSKYNVPAEHAELIAKSFVLADLRGVDTRY